MSSSPIAPAVVSATNDLLDQVVKATIASRRQALRQKLLPVDEVVKATEQESTAAAVTFDEFEFSPPPTLTPQPWFQGVPKKNREKNEPWLK